MPPSMSSSFDNLYDGILVYSDAEPQMENSRKEVGCIGRDQQRSLDIGKKSVF